MKQTSIFKLLLSLKAVQSCAGQDHNFLVTFDKDLRSVFGVKKLIQAPTVPVVKEVSDKKVVKEVSVNEFDRFDFDRAEEDIFNNVENAEKAILKAASHLIQDEVDVLFGVGHGKRSMNRNELVVKKDRIQKKEDQAMKKSNRRSSKVKTDEVNPLHRIDAIADVIFE